MANILKREYNAQPANFGTVVDQIFQNNLSRFFDDSFWGAGGNTGNNKVPVNLRETDTTYEMELVAPGLRKEDFQLNVTRDMLTVSFEEKNENKETSQQGWVKQEFRKRSFSRSFQLNDSVDINGITARYENGILYLSLPKDEKLKQTSKTIKVE